MLSTRDFVSIYLLLLWSCNTQMEVSLQRLSLQDFRRSRPTIWTLISRFKFLVKNSTFLTKKAKMILHKPLIHLPKNKIISKNKGKQEKKTDRIKLKKSQVKITLTNSLLERLRQYCARWIHNYTLIRVTRLFMRQRMAKITSSKRVLVQVMINLIRTI